MFEIKTRWPHWRCAVFLLVCSAMPASGQSGSAHASKKPTADKPVPPGLLAPLPVEIKTAQAQFLKAVALQRARKMAQAIDAYGEYLRIIKVFRMQPQAAVPAKLNLAQIYQAQGNQKAEQAQLQEVTQLDPRNATAWAELAAIAAAQHRFADAKQLADRALALNPPPVLAAPAHFALGLVAMERNDLATAEKEFGTSVRLVPENMQAVYNYALVLGRRKKLKQALVQIERVVAVAPRVPQTQFYRAYLKQELHDLYGALGVYNDFLKLDPTSVPGLFNRALLYQELGQSQNAVGGYLDVLARQPKNLLAHKNLARLYYTDHRYDLAREQYNSALALAPKDPDVLAGLGLSELQEASGAREPIARKNELQQAEQHLKTLEALDPHSEIARDTLAFFYERVGRFGDALSIYRAQLAQAPDKIDPYYKIARTYTMQRNIDGVVAIWKEYRTHKPDDPVSYIQAARILEAGGKFDEAIAQWQLLAAKQPNDGNVTLAIAQDEAQRQRPDEARKGFLAVLSPAVTENALKDPKSPAQIVAAARALRLEAFRGLAQLARTDKKPDEELKWLKEAQQLQLDEAAKIGRPPDPEAFRSLARAYEQHQDMALAEKEYMGWAQALPKDPEPYLNLARIYDDQNNVIGSEGAYRKAAALARNPADDLTQLAEMYHRRKMFDQAIAEYEALEKRYPGESRFYSPLAQIEEQAGKDDRALVQWEALLKSDPNARWAQDRRAGVLVRLKRYDEARGLYEKEIETNSESPQIYAELARVYGLQGKPDAYLTWLKARFQKTPTNRVLIGTLVDLYQQRGVEADGWKYVRGVVEADKTQPGVLEALAGVYLQRGKTPEALELYQEDAALNPKDFVKQTTLAQQLYANGKQDEAIGIYEQVVARTDVPGPQRAGFRRQLIGWYQEQKKTALAIAQCREVLKTMPNDYAVTVNLATMLAASGGEAEAVTLLLGLNRVDAYPAVARAQLLMQVAAIYERQGRKSDAIGEYREVLKLDPQSHLATEALKRLAGS